MRELPNPTFALSPLSLPRGLLHRPAESVQKTSPDQSLPAEHGTLVVSWARHQDEVRAVQRLRYRVFADEMGARLNTNLPGHDIDLFDNYCEHLLVRDARTHEVVDTYRLLTPIQTQRAGST